MFLRCFTRGKYTFLNKKSIKWDLVCYAKDMLGALQNLHLQDSDRKIVIKHRATFKKYCSLWFRGNGLQKKGGHEDGIVWVVQQEPDELVILFHK